MRWPWASREVLEMVIERFAEAERERADATRHLLDQQEARYADLLAKYQALKLAGAVEVPTPSTPVALPATEPDEMVELIHAKSGGNLRRRALMLRQLAQDRRDGIEEEQIQARIEHGIPSDGVPA